MRSDIKPSNGNVLILNYFSMFLSRFSDFPNVYLLKVIYLKVLIPSSFA